MKRGFLILTLSAALVAFFHITPCANAQTAAPAAEAATGAESGSGGANAPEQDPALPSGISVDELNSLHARFGLPKPKLPEAPKPKTPEPAKKEDEFVESAEEKAAREMAEAEAKKAKEGTETAEEKAARETAEAEAKAKAEAGGETIELELTAEHEAYIAQELEARTADLTKRAIDAETKAAELESKVQTLGVKVGPVPAGVHPLFLTDSEADVTKHQQELSEFKRFATEHFDGYESADGKVSFTKEQIRSRLASVEQELEQIIPAARQSLQMRAAWEPVVKKTYPTLYDPKHEDYRVAQGILRACPNLRLFPNHMILIGDALAGEKARLAKAPAAAQAAGGSKIGVVVKNGKKTIVVKKAAPRVASGTKAAPASASDRRTIQPRGGVDNAGFAKAGGSRSALTAAVAKFLGA